MYIDKDILILYLYYIYEYIYINTYPYTSTKNLPSFRSLPRIGTSSHQTGLALPVPFVSSALLPAATFWENSPKSPGGHAEVKIYGGSYVFPHVRFQKRRVNMCMTMYIIHVCMIWAFMLETRKTSCRDPRRIAIKLSINAMMFLQKMVTWSSGKSPHSFPISKCRHSETCGTWDVWLIDRFC